MDIEQWQNDTDRRKPKNLLEKQPLEAQICP